MSTVTHITEAVRQGRFSAVRDFFTLSTLPLDPEIKDLFRALADRHAPQESFGPPDSPLRRKLLKQERDDCDAQYRYRFS